MATPLGNPVSRLVRERAYRSGALKTLEQEEAIAREQVRVATTALRAIKRRYKDTLARIAVLDQEIEAQVAFDPTLIRAIRSTPRLGHFKHGELTAELVRVLNELEPPIPTRRIVWALVPSLGLPYDTPAEREATRRRIVERLRVLSRKGAIQRLHATVGNREGLWLWRGL